ncbi:MAG TPA: hypothetical protein VFQ88_15220 [Nevskiaceae bacterium]|nr:hypothetical protein [Nevskiaceae bacterium]
MPLNESRYKRRLDYLTKDPSGPQQKRLDVLLDKDDYALFQEIMDRTNERRREALHTMLRERYDAIMAKSKETPRAPSTEAPQSSEHTPWDHGATA